MEVKFCKNDLVVKDQNIKVVLTGRRDKERLLELIPIGEQKFIHMQHLRTMADITKNKPANSNYHQQTLPKLTSYLHVYVGIIPLTTWTKTIVKEWFISWLGLTTNVMQKYLQKTRKIIMGHMHRIRKGIIPSTKFTTEEIMND